MLFKVTHISPTNQARRARVSATCRDDAMDQVDQAWGAARAVACMCLPTRPVLRVVPSTLGRADRRAEVAPCGL